MSREPGTKVIERRDHGTRTVSGVVVEIEELVWNGTDGRSWDVYRVSDNLCLTMDGSFDDMPGDDKIAELIAAPRNEYGNISGPADSTPGNSAGNGPFWCCPGCGAVYSESDPDCIVDHVQGCDKVDGAGNPV